jgi:hypothetical protein
VTCMLLDRAEDSEKAPTVTAHKIGMCNVPPYIFAQTVKSGTIYVGNDSEYRVTRHQVEFIILWKWWLLIIRVVYHCTPCHFPNLLALILSSFIKNSLR